MRVPRPSRRPTARLAALLVSESQEAGLSALSERDSAELNQMSADDIFDEFTVDNPEWRQRWSSGLCRAAGMSPGDPGFAECQRDLLESIETDDASGMSATLSATEGCRPCKMASQHTPAGSLGLLLRELVS